LGTVNPLYSNATSFRGCKVASLPPDMRPPPLAEIQANARREYPGATVPLPRDFSLLVDIMNKQAGNYSDARPILSRFAALAVSLTREASSPSCVGGAVFRVGGQPDTSRVARAVPRTPRRSGVVFSVLDNLDEQRGKAGRRQPLPRPARRHARYVHSIATSPAKALSGCDLGPRFWQQRPRTLARCGVTVAAVLASMSC